MNQSLEHILIYKYFNKSYVKGVSIHHKDGNGLNNSIDNLIQISQAEHMSHHIKEFWNSLTLEERSALIKSHVTEETRRKIGNNSLARRIASIIIRASQ